ncbi:MAG: tRNA lysidine(34) synthetase TilS [Lachnospira sp.]|nr:tRNA lysidine(34) synthetase TilS [Lachnospira sp.]
MHEIQQYMEQWNRMDKIKHIVVGVSGGADSMCLLEVLNRLSRKWNYEIIVVHVHHGIRGERADSDQQFVEQFCRERKLSFRVFQADVPALSKEWGMTVEEAGRTFRYQCFFQVARTLPDSVVAVAHHSDDQAETVLFRLARGTGLRGLCGMTPVSEQDGVTVIRPLLCIDRSRVEELLASWGMSYCQDETNASEAYRRNYVRHTLLPQMKVLNEQAVRHINELAQQSAEVMDYLSSETEQAYERLVKRKDAKDTSNVLTASRQALAACHEVIRSEVLRRMITELCGSGKDITRQHIGMLHSLLLSVENGTKYYDFPYGIRAGISYDTFWMASKEEALTGKDDVHADVTQSWLSVQERSRGDFHNFPKNNYTKIIDYATIKGDLFLRYKKPGDKLVIDRQGHKKSLSRFFIDEKVPEPLRQRIPLVCDEEQIIWVVGYRLNPLCYVTQSTKRVYELVVQTDQ